MGSIKVICIKTTVYDATNDIPKEYCVDYSEAEMKYQLEIGKVYTVLPYYDMSMYSFQDRYYIEEKDNDYSITLFEPLAEFREKQINKILDI